VSELKRLTAAEILAADDITFEEVEVPEWGAIVRVRSLTGVDRDRLEAEMIQQRGKNQIVNFVNFRAKLIVASAVDEEGSLLFSQQQILPLGNKNAQALSRVFTVASRLSGFSESDVQDLTAELGNDLSGEPGSGSPLISVLDQ
jgi:hypothetical protein